MHELAQDKNRFQVIVALSPMKYSQWSCLGLASVLLITGCATMFHFGSEPEKEPYAGGLWEKYSVDEFEIALQKEEAAVAAGTSIVRFLPSSAVWSRWRTELKPGDQIWRFFPMPACFILDGDGKSEGPTGFVLIRDGKLFKRLDER